MERDFEIGGRKFRLNKIPAMAQFRIVRRITPILSEMLPNMKHLGKVKDFSSESEKLEQIAQFVGPIMSGLSKLSDEDADKVLFGLLASVEIHQGDLVGWAKVSTESMLMFQDLELPAMLQIAGRAFMFNMAGFFQGLPQK